MDDPPQPGRADPRMPQHFTPCGEHAEFRPVASAPLLRCIGMIKAAIEFAREGGIAKLLVDTTGLSGFTPPGTLDRIWMAHQFARTAGSAVKVALVARPELIHPEKIGVMVARNRGMLTDVFSDEDAARAWLLDPAAR